MARGAVEIPEDNAAVVARLSVVVASPRFCDMHVHAMALVSERDGTRTPAAAIMLASCSPVFLNMLTGGFAEGAVRGRKRSKTGTGADASTSASSPDQPALTVSCAFSGAVLAAVVEFAATNDAGALWEGSIDVLSEMLEASDYYDVGGLRVKVKRHLVSRARTVPAEACEVLQAMWGRWAMDEFGTGTAAGFVAEDVLRAIDEYADRALVGCGCLCEEAMRKVLGGQGVNADEADLFRALERWLSVDMEGRQAAGGRLVSCLSFERMPPSFLMSTVARSGLVSKEALCSIFETQALKAEIDHGFESCKRLTSCLPKFCRTGSTVCDSRVSDVRFELLDRSFDSGCWAWDFRVEMNCSNFSFGLVAESFDFVINWWEDEKYQYSYEETLEHGGYISCLGKRTRPGVCSSCDRFRKGDMIHATLDCDVGTLSFGVNKRKPVKAFTELNPVGGPNVTFTPAVTIDAPGRVRLLQFGRVECGKLFYSPFFAYDHVCSYQLSAIDRYIISLF